MTDDSFIREVNEELRQDRAKAAWRRYRFWLIAAAVLIVALTAAYVGWERYETSRANASGDHYLAAVDLAEAGNHEAAAAELTELAQDGYGAYPMLARMRLGAVRQAQGDAAAAVAEFDAVASDGSAPQALRDMAAIRAAYVLVDSGTLADVRSRVERLSGDAEPLRFSAREALGVAAWKAGELEDARRLFEQLRDDAATPRGIAARARLMLDVIAAGSGSAAAALSPASPAVPAAPAAPPAAPAAPAPAASVAAPAAPDAAQPVTTGVPPASTSTSAAPAATPAAPAASAPAAVPPAQPVAPPVQNAQPAPASPAPPAANVPAAGTPAAPPAAGAPAVPATPAQPPAAPAPPAAPLVQPAPAVPPA